MTTYFMDSSALLKRYVSEAGADWVQRITQSDANNAIVIAQITPVEVASALARLRRENKLTPETAANILRVFERHFRTDYDEVFFDRIVSHRATALIEKYPLRAYDAVQLASAVILNEQLQARNQPPLTFVSADVRLLAVAEAAGLPIVNPNTAA